MIGLEVVSRTTLINYDQKKNGRITISVIIGNTSPAIVSVCKLFVYLFGKLTFFWFLSIVRQLRLFCTYSASLVQGTNQM